MENTQRIETLAATILAGMLANSNNSGKGSATLAKLSVEFAREIASYAADSDSSVCCSEQLELTPIDEPVIAPHHQSVEVDFELAYLFWQGRLYIHSVAKRHYIVVVFLSKYKYDILHNPP